MTEWHLLSNGIKSCCMLLLLLLLLFCLIDLCVDVLSSTTKSWVISGSAWQQQRVVGPSTSSSPVCRKLQHHPHRSAVNFNIILTGLL
jgi:hypothetical protein